VCLEAPAAATRKVDGVQVSETYVYQFWLDPNASVTFSTFSSLYGDPVLHLFYRGSDGAGGFAWIQVASNDSATTGPEASVSWQNGASVKSMLLLVRGKSAGGAQGITHLRRNGAVFRYYVPLGGRFMAPHGFTWGVGDHLRTAQRPGGSTAQLLVRFSDSAGLAATELGLLNSVARSAAVTMASPTSAIFVATPFIELEGVVDPIAFRGGPVDLRMNDVANDYDGDGLGNFLEGALQTCVDTLTCGYAYFPWDSDRDGLSDLEEVFGLVSTLDPDADVALPRWGAKPRRKDVFVEVDHLAEPDGHWNSSTCLAGEDPFQCLRDDPGVDFFGAYNHDGALDTVEGWVDAIRTPFLLGSATALKNPDGSNGLAVHLDIGVPPLEDSLEDEAYFGDYGSPSSRRVVEDWYVELIAKPDGPPPYDIYVFVLGAWIPGGLAFALVDGAALGETYTAWMTRLASALANTSTGLNFREMKVVSPIVVDKFVAGLRVRAGEAQEVFDVFILAVDGAKTADLADRIRHGKENSVSKDSYSSIARGRNHYANEQFDPARRTKFRYAVISAPWSTGNSAGLAGNMMSASCPSLLFTSSAISLGFTIGDAQSGTQTTSARIWNVSPNTAPS